MGYGYTLRVAEQNVAADPELLGVQLGKLCIHAAIPVTSVADKLGVSRQTVYNWFSGTVKLSARYSVAVRELIAALS